MKPPIRKRNKPARYDDETDDGDHWKKRKACKTAINENRGEVTLFSNV